MINNNSQVPNNISGLQITLKSLGNHLQAGNLDQSITYINKLYNQLHYRYDQAPNKAFLTNDTELSSILGTYANTCCTTHFYHFIRQQLERRKAWVLDIPEPSLIDDINFQVTTILLTSLKLLPLMSKLNTNTQTAIGTCDFSSKECHAYLDKLAQKELRQYQRLPKFARLALRMALIPECPIKLPYDLEYILESIKLQLINAQPELKKTIDKYLKLKMLHLNIIALHQRYFKHGEQAASSRILHHSVKLENKTFAMLLKLLELILCNKYKSSNFDQQYVKLAKHYSQLKSEMRIKRTVN